MPVSMRLPHQILHLSVYPRPSAVMTRRQGQTLKGSRADLKVFIIYTSIYLIYISQSFSERVRCAPWPWPLSL